MKRFLPFLIACTRTYKPNPPLFMKRFAVNIISDHHSLHGGGEKRCISAMMMCIISCFLFSVINDSRKKHVRQYYYLLQLL